VKRSTTIVSSILLLLLLDEVGPHGGSEAVRADARDGDEYREHEEDDRHRHREPSGHVARDLTEPPSESSTFLPKIARNHISTRMWLQLACVNIAVNQLTADGELHDAFTSHA
jgi:hypothetical protein